MVAFFEPGGEAAAGFRKDGRRESDVVEPEAAAFVAEALLQSFGQGFGLHFLG